MFCGEGAVCHVPGLDVFSSEYYCELHRPAGAIDIPREHVIRRVHFSIDVWFAGASNNLSQSHEEALARLDRAVTAAGGLFEVKRLHSSLVKSLPAPYHQEVIGRTGRGE
jgi:hypothetical protein